MALVFVGCGGALAPTAKCDYVTATSASAGLPAGLMLTAAPAGAKDVVAVKSEAKEGDAVVVRGAIGGRVKTFVSGFAMFTIGDMKALTSCNNRPDDPCETPWDFCCDVDIP